MSFKKNLILFIALTSTLAACVTRRHVSNDDDGLSGQGLAAGSTTTSPSGSGGSTLAAGGAGGATTDPPAPKSTAESLADQQQTHGWSANACAPLPANVSLGYKVGNQMDTLTLKDCEGNDVSLEEVCGADATWMFFAHAWCPHCRQTGSLAEGIHDSFQGINIASINVVVESAQRNPPTEADCKAWREQYAHGDVLTLFDPLGVSFKLWETNSTALNMIFDGDRVITHKFHSDVEGAIKNNISSALP